MSFRYRRSGGPSSLTGSGDLHKGVVLVFVLIGTAGCASRAVQPPATLTNTVTLANTNAGVCPEIPSASTAATSLYQSGKAYASKGQYDLAIQQYDQAIQLDASFADAYNGRGNALSAEGKWDPAIRNYDQGIRLQPNGACLYNNRGNAYNLKGQYDLAIQDYNKAIRLAPNYDTAYFDRGVVFRTLGQKDRAAADFAKAAQLRPR